MDVDPESNRVLVKESKRAKGRDGLLRLVSVLRCCRYATVPRAPPLAPQFRAVYTIEGSGRSSEPHLLRWRQPELPHPGIFCHLEHL